MNETLNRALLDEINEAAIWFRARKTRPIWAKEILNGQFVDSLEGSVRIKLGDFVCRGDAGETWPQSAERLLAKYRATEQVDSDGWRKYEPQPDQAGVMAAEVAHPFEIDTDRGRLTGKEGDYLVKDFDEAAARYPKNVWIVDRTLFNATYTLDKAST